MIESLTAESFEPHIGSVFLLVDAARTEPAPSLELRLRDMQRGMGRPGAREPFSLHFLGPRDPILPQRIYRLEHPAMDALALFIVPIAADAAGVTYEAVFN
jgi:hypothetical protein